MANTKIPGRLLGTSGLGAITSSGNIVTTSTSAVIQTPRISMEADGTLDWGASREYGTLTWDTNKAIIAGQANSSLEFRTDTSGVAMTIDTSQRVGIGTTSPATSTKLEINGDGELLRLDGSGGVARSMRFRGLSTSALAMITIDGSFKLHCEDAGTHIEFHTADTERMRIDGSGNVGIGETNPGSRLTVGDDAHGVGIDYVGSTLPSIAGIFTSSSGLSQTAYGDLNIKARTDYGGNYSIGFFTASSNNTPALRMKINSGGSLIPAGNNLYNLGDTAYRFANIFTNDLNLSNEGTGGNDVDGTEGNWTIQEGKTDLYIINNKNGKKYKFALEEL